MRGKVENGAASGAFSRITPAYAGKRQLQSGLQKNTEDHPRLCGEKKNDDELIVSVKGSPPPMRGKVCAKILFRSAVRITPAYAGKSSSLLKFRRLVLDHPRLCGEK